jgi:hypothetical protein
MDVDNVFEALMATAENSLKCHFIYGGTWHLEKFKGYMDRLRQLVEGVDAEFLR